MPKHLMGAREIEARLGVSRQRVQQLTARPDWPKPYDELAMGKVWRIADIEAWIRKNRPDLTEMPPPTADMARDNVRPDDPEPPGPTAEE